MKQLVITIPPDPTVRRCARCAHWQPPWDAGLGNMAPSGICGEPGSVALRELSRQINAPHLVTRPGLGWMAGFTRSFDVCQDWQQKPAQ